jgi:transcriptional regulator with XRE-family HTH domain
MAETADRVDRVVGQRLRQRRKLLGLTQVEVARACGVKFQQIAKYESAANRLSAAMLWKLCQILGVGVGYFFDGLQPPAAAADVRDQARPAASQ